jgi:Flp pilus assembly pilin Flp
VVNDNLLRGEQGQTMAEYAVVLGVITPVIVLLFTALLDPMQERIATLIGWLT